jgi:hypothetical protein
MNRGPAFIEREVFERVLAEVPRLDGMQYQDPRTAYGDMSRLVVGWLARTSPNELQSLYSELGWESCANVRQFHLAAKHWLRTYHSKRFEFAETDDNAAAAFDKAAPFTMNQ